MNKLDVDAKFPKKMQFLFKPKRYKVAYGGRGSAKSWTFAKVLIMLAMKPQMIWPNKNRIRILCGRETQKSIKQSVHKLLGDQIISMGVSADFTILETEIRCNNGSEFNFTGLADHTVDSIKSYEGCDIVWIEEAQTVSKKSWDILIPTIRKDDSEIWIGFNPELDTDETYVRFVINPPENCEVAFVNYNDNPWFPEVLEQERLHCQITNPDDYPTIWEGKCRSAVIGAIYAKEVELAVREGRVANVPYNPLLKVHTIWDLGWNDSMFIILVQKVRSEISIIEVIEDSHKTLDWYIGELQNKRYNWGYDYLPHDGFHGDYKSPSADAILKKFGRKVKATPNIGIEEGIKLARMSFRQMVFDRNKSERLLECLKRYKRIISKNGEPGSPLHDQYSHGADAFRYLSIVAEQLSNEDQRSGSYSPKGFTPNVSGMGM